MPHEKMVQGLLAFFAVMIVSIVAIPAHSQSASECAARADRAARDSTGILGGAVVGSAGGAAFGAIVSDKRGKGAGRGAALGAVVGGAAGSVNKNKVYKRVYDECMSGR